MRCLVFVAVLALAAPTFAQEPAPAQPTVTLTASQFDALIGKAVATGLQASAASAPASAQAPAKISDGILGIGWETILATLGTLLAALFAALKGATALKVRKTIQLAAETGWLVSERLGQTYGLPGAQKASLALGEFLKVFSDAGIPVPPAAVAQAEALFVSRSAAAGLGAPATPPVDPAKLAAAQAAAAVASKPGSATDLANEASK